MRTWVPPHSSRENEPSPTSTIRTTSPYFSLNSAIAPSRRASSSVVVIARTDWLARIQRVDVVLDVGELLGAQRAAVREVEPQLVGPNVGARLAHVVAEPPAQRGVQQMGRRVVAGGRVARCAVDVRAHALAGLERAVLGDQRQHLIGTEPQHVVDARQAAAAGALDRPRVGHLAAAGGVERRLDQLHEQPSVVARPRRRSSSRRRSSRSRRTRSRSRRCRRARAPARADRRRPGRDRSPRARASAAPPSAIRSPPRRRPRPCSATISSVMSIGKP